MTWTYWSIYQSHMGTRIALSTKPDRLRMSMHASLTFLWFQSHQSNFCNEAVEENSFCFMSKLFFLDWTFRVDLGCCGSTKWQSFAGIRRQFSAESRVDLVIIKVTIHHTRHCLPHNRFQQEPNVTPLL